MLIRPYAASDRGSVAVLDVETEVNSVAVMRLTDGRFTWRESSLQVARKKRHDLTGYLDEDPRSWDEGFVAILDGLVVGFAASAFSAWNRRLVLQHMYVDGAARGSGVGTALLRAVLSSERAKDAQHAWLETQADNVPAIRAYERMGFRVVGLDQTLYGDRAEADTAVFMSQPVGHEQSPCRTW
jgi:ribosomal protein S18 acetylase RimI-like enzyme